MRPSIDRLVVAVIACASAGCFSLRPARPVPKSAPGTAPAIRVTAPPAPTPRSIPAPADPAPPSFVRSTSDTKSTRTVDIRDRLTRATAFRLATEALATRFTIDVSDPRAGFLMTTWRASALRVGVPDLRYRTRITVRLAPGEPRRLTVRADANWQRGDEWDIGFDSALLEQVAADLRAKLGRR